MMRLNGINRPVSVFVPFYSLLLFSYYCRLQMLSNRRLLAKISNQELYSVSIYIIIIRSMNICQSVNKMIRHAS